MVAQDGDGSAAAGSGRKWRSRWAIVPQKHRQILKLLRQGIGIKRTASIVGVGVRTVQRRKVIIEAELNDPSTDEELQIDFKSKPGTVNCPVHGPVVIWPCVACAAIAAKQAAANRGGTRPLPG